ncbi:hypothetical protein D3C74_386010 [compost metagenome]
MKFCHLAEQYFNAVLHFSSSFSIVFRNCRKSYSTAGSCGAAIKEMEYRSERSLSLNTNPSEQRCFRHSTSLISSLLFLCWDKPRYLYTSSGERLLSKSKMSAILSRIEQNRRSACPKASVSILVDIHTSSIPSPWLSHSKATRSLIGTTFHRISSASPIK